ncbi:hypothetical protein LOK49_LG14G00478 [Camellia lanceoleosa]|uniref:Uncharacterized protein n=1 Tax=Camellia lanceoleosa TaxID=1840588 RepID=A0ACC0F9P7_9ERIC|nr:hypothetical protein LOK49_LG14G00478 [Camellia lanceoleosa]
MGWSPSFAGATVAGFFSLFFSLLLPVLSFFSSSGFSSGFYYVFPPPPNRRDGELLQSIGKREGTKSMCLFTAHFPSKVKAPIGLGF